MRTKPKCQLCRRIFLGGQDGICDRCGVPHLRRNKIKPIRCLCGKVAVIILLGDVLTPEGETMVVEVPLCRDCRELEIELEATAARIPGPGGVNPIQLIVVKNLPRTKPGLRGRKL